MPGEAKLRIFSPVSRSMVALKSAKSSVMAWEAPRITQSKRSCAAVAILKKGLLRPVVYSSRSDAKTRPP